MRYPVLTWQDESQETFVEFWSSITSLRDEKNEESYRTNVGQQLTKDRIRSLFEWKNGGPLSARKANSVSRYFNQEEQIPANATTAELTQFLTRPGGAIWRIFWLHIQHPSRFPIYDQHVHRAMAYLMQLHPREMPEANKDRVRAYLDDYVPFFAQFSAMAPRQVDRALWTFGKFLSTGLCALLGRPFTIPRQWLKRRVTVDDPEYIDIIKSWRQVKRGDEIWSFDEPAPPGVNAGELGFALVRNGMVIDSITTGIR